MTATFSAEAMNTSLASEEKLSNGQLLESIPIYRIRMYLWYTLGPAIFFLGNFGNIMIIIIMRRMKSGESVINIYFTAMAVVDLITLDVYFLADWSRECLNWWIAHSHNIVCKIYVWFATQITTTSAWFLVCMTVHRAISVVWPHRVNLVCTRRKVIVALTVITVMMACTYSHYLYGFGLVPKQESGRLLCTIEQGSYATFLQGVFLHVQTVLYSVVPFVCLVIANGIMIWKLMTSAREADQTFAAGVGGGEMSKAREKAARSVTRTIVCVSVAFLVLTLPISIHQAVTYVMAETHQISVYQFAGFRFLKSLFFLMAFANHAVNFYLYCLTGKRFREEFLNIICCGKATHSTGVVSKSKDSSTKITR
ncbi:hypothetical protein ACOMHN_064267 [Nucella lapillus]